jgi:hypothetical protein
MTSEVKSSPSSTRSGEKTFRRCDDHCMHDDHPFYVILTNDERYALRTQLSSFFHGSMEELKSYSYKRPIALQSLVDRLVTFFDAHRDANQSWFLKSSVVSPKDAFYQLYPSSSGVTEEKLHSHINFLRVGSRQQGTSLEAAEHCIKVLCHRLASLIWFGSDHQRHH